MVEIKLNNIVVDKTKEEIEVLTTEELNALVLDDYKKELLAKADNEAKDSFFKAKDEAFAALKKRHDDELIALGSLWQAKEDSGYDVSFVPKEEVLLK